MSLEFGGHEPQVVTLKFDDRQFDRLLPLLDRLVAVLEDKAAIVALTAKLKDSEGKLAAALVPPKP